MGGHNFGTVIYSADVTCGTKGKGARIPHFTYVRRVMSRLSPLQRLSIYPGYEDV